MPIDLDEDVIVATVELIGRTGARDFEFGYLHDDVPVEQAGWWAKAQYRGSRITVENQPGPIQALEALAHRVLTGARCQHCHGLVALSDWGGIAFPSLMSDGTTWTEDEIRSAPLCRWRRVGKHWQRGCAMAPRRSRKQKRGRR